MKELLTKKFWQDVKKTFDEAREEPPPPVSHAPALEDGKPPQIPSKPDQSSST